MVRGLAGTERRRNVFAFCLAKSCGFGYGFQPLYGHKGFFTEYCRDQCVARMHPREGPWPGRPGRTTLIHPIAIYYEASIQILAGSDCKRARPFRMERAKPHQRQAFSGKPDVWFEDILYGEVPDLVDGGFAYHTVLRRFQHSMIDCPEYLGRLRFWGLSGLM